MIIAFTRFGLILLVFCQLAACTIIPGQHMSPFSRQSSVEMPTRENDEAILEKLNIQTINAELIIELEKNYKNFSLAPDNVANHYFDYRIGSSAIKGTPMKNEPYTQYRVGPRDILNITVWDHPELTIPAGEFRSAEAAGNVVGEDGTFFYPYVGIVQAAGRTVEDIREELTRRLSKYIEFVQLDVRVASYRSQRVYVVGEVAQPGVQLVRDIPLTVLEAINNAGGVNSDADLRNIILTRDDKTYSINLLSLYEGGDVTQNVLLRHGDVLNVPDSSLNKVFVLGETNHFVAGGAIGRSRSLVMNKARMTLTEALSEAGGFDQETSDPARIFVFRGGLGKPEIYHLNAKSPDALLLADRFPLQPRDVIYVDRAEGIRWNQIIGQIQPTINLLNAFDGALRVQPFLRR
ncbi:MULTISPECIES: polysaccharide export protein [Nitrosomonas]|uniref:Polysaccharide export protein n=3 Tax=Nitrosomonas TaxID=914 RepID=Q82SN2_NITEU|nr:MULTISPECIES: polysaccharide export protein [Nitrosomonas]MCE7917206.1 sugar transporter [Nitrosomonas sp. PRO5]QOJ10267.1 MAG: polysaccharide biosynthesis/export family protein [Nitrosomonas sp. H1_AOB3]CAD86191.1 Polysaccharide export protein [Nitrosomonas europaea ATCC 19718]HBF25943.1 sugar transporter [Nitrosomonas sp.]HNR10481.1 polysaccharide export protein [Nitrosomonas europaea]